MALRRNLAVMLYVSYLAITLARWHFQFWSGCAIIKVGYVVRDWVNPELAHVLFIHLLRWTYWQPKWVDEAKRQRTR